MKLSPQLVEQLVAHQREPDRILELFRQAGLGESALAKVNSTPDPAKPYSRVVLSSAPECEVMLARWTPNQECAPHNHGASSGWVFYLQQDFAEQSYTWKGGELKKTQMHRHPAGSHTEVRRNEIHSCHANGEGLSLHVYFPRIEKMCVYDSSERRTVTVADDCGAWIPDRPEQRVKEVAWP